MSEGTKLNAKSKQQQQHPQQDKYYGGLSQQEEEEEEDVEGNYAIEMEPTSKQTTTQTSPTTPTTPIDESSWWKTELAGLTGNILEWYDFALFGFFNDIISTTFFPPHQPNHLAIIESFLVFGGAFLMRPVGGILLGGMGDSVGRKVALETSVFLMAFPTFLLGCLPSYESVGWVSTLLLIVVRLMQGLSVGGQLVSSLVFLLERNEEEKERWGFHGSAVMAAACSGTLLGGLVGTAMRAFVKHDVLYGWAWRVPFLCGIVVGWSGLYLKKHVKNDGPPPYNNKQAFSYHDDHDDDEEGNNETTAIYKNEDDATNNKNKTTNPLKIALSKPYRQSLLSCCMVPAVWAGGFYLIYVWMAIFMEDIVSPSIPHAFTINSTSLFLCTVVLFPFAGSLSDVYGRVKIMTIGAVCIAIFGPVTLHIIYNKGAQYPYLALLAQFTLGNMLSLWGAPMCAWMVESFPPQARLTAVSIGYNVAMAIAGGMSPFLATVMVDLIGPCSPGYLILVLAVISLVGLYIAPSSSSSSSLS